MQVRVQGALLVLKTGASYTRVQVYMQVYTVGTQHKSGAQKLNSTFTFIRVVDITIGSSVV